MEWILNFKEHRNTSLGEFYLNLTSNLLSKQDEIGEEDKKELKRILKETESLNFHNLTEFTQNMTIAIVSNVKDKLLEIPN